MDWVRAVEWAPTIAVAAVALILCAGAAWLPERPSRRRIAVPVALLCGAIAVAATVWQHRQMVPLDIQAPIAPQKQPPAPVADGPAARHVYEQAAMAALAKRLQGAWQRLDAIDTSLPPAPGPAPKASFDSVADGFAALDAVTDDLQKRVSLFRDASHGRTVDDATATAMIDYLRPHGPHRAVVTCVPDDQEAYFYANRLATILRQAGWEADGPEVTAIFGTAPAMGVSLYVAPGGQQPEAANLLVDALTRFNIPYQSRIAGNNAIPDRETIEIFVGKKS